MDIKTFRRTTPSSVGRSGIDRSIDRSIVSCQSCVVYTTFVGNSVLSFTTSELNINLLSTRFHGVAMVVRKPGKGPQHKLRDSVSMAESESQTPMVNPPSTLL